MRKVLYILGQLDDKDLQWMLDAGRKEPLAAGTTIIHEGQPLDRIFIVLDGQLEVTRAGDPIARLGAGEFVGELSLLDSRPPIATVTAVEDSSVFTVPQDRIRRKLEQDVGFAARFYRSICIFLANRLSRTVGLVSGSETMSLQERHEDEIDPEVLDTVNLAAARFGWFLERVGAG